MKNQTQGSEPSQYLEEKKATAIPSVAASERGTAQTTDMLKLVRVVSAVSRDPAWLRHSGAGELQRVVLAEYHGKGNHRR